jgi:hypothetical protein
MDKFLLAAVVTIATIAPALAQTNQVRYSQRSIVTPRTITVPVPLTSSCGPYLGGWQEGYPGTARC